MSVSLVSERPPVLASEDHDAVLSDGGVTLVLGAPHIGKTELFDALTDDTELTHTETLADTDTGEPVVVDDFYTAYQQADPAASEVFHDSLPDADGLCLSTRPRDFAWLCDPPDDADIDPLGEQVLDAITQVVTLQFSTDYSGDWQGNDGTVDGDTLKHHADRLSYKYEFEGAIADHLDTDQYGPTLVPPVGLTLDTDASTREGLTGSIREYLGSAGLGMLTGPVKDLGTTAAESARAIRDGEAEMPDIDPDSAGALLNTTGVSAASALGGPLPGTLALGLLLWRVGPADDVGGLADDLFEHLLDDRLTPLNRANLEAGLSLLPRTLDSLDDLADSKILDALALLPEIQAKVEAVQDVVRENRERLEAVEADLAEIQPVVEKNIDRATSDLADFERKLAEAEANLVGRASSPETVEYETDEGKSEITEICEYVEDSETDVVVLRGPHGTGKSTAAYKACRRLASEYDVRLPNVADASEVTLRHVFSETDRETLAFVSYRQGLDPSQLDSPSDMRKLANLTDCATILVECRDEFYDAFDLNAPPALSNAPIVEFGRFGASDDEEIEPGIERIVRRTLDALDYEGDADAVVWHAGRLAEGNPEIAKLVARVAIEDRVALEDVETPTELVWADVQSVFQSQSVTVNGRAVGGSVYERVCAMPGITTHDLDDLLDVVPRAKFGACAESLAGYLGGEVRDAVVAGSDDTDADADGGAETDADTESSGGFSVAIEVDDETDSAGESTSDDGRDGAVALDGDEAWMPAPAIYGRVVFERKGLDATTFGGYLDELAENQQSHLVPALGNQLASVYGAATDHEGNVDMQVLARVETLFDHNIIEDLAPEAFVDLLWSLLIRESPVPVPAAEFSRHREQLLDGAEARSDGLSADSGVVVYNLVGRAYGAVQPLGANEADHLDDVATTLAGQCHRRFDTDHGEFLGNVYSIAFDPLTRGETNPDDPSIETWVSEVERRAEKTARNMDGVESPEQFLENLYAMALDKLRKREADPSAESVVKWIDEVEMRAKQMAGKADTHTFSRGQFLVNVYAHTLKMFSDTETDPSRVIEWVDEMETRAEKTARNNDAHDVSPTMFLENLYAMALSGFAEKESDPSAEAVTEWVDEVEVRAKAMAGNEDAHDDSQGQFLANVYAMVLGHLAEQEANPSTQAVTKWVDYIEKQISGTATSDTHSMGRAGFIGVTYGLGVTNILLSESNGPRAWTETLADRAVDALLVSETDVFYDTIRSALVQSPNPIGLSWPVEDVIDRTVETDVPLGECRDQRVELVARSATDIARRIQDGAGIEYFDSAIFQRIVSQVATIATTDEAFFDAVATRVADDLGNAADADNEVSAPSAWLERVYPDAIATIADANTPDPERIEAIHTRGREAISERGRDVLADYHRRTLDAVPTDVAPDWQVQLFDHLTGGGVREDYLTGLQHVVAGNDQRAINQLLDVWGEWPTVPKTSESASHVLAGGVALAVLVRDDPVFSSVHEEVREAVESHRERLPDPAQPVSNHLLDAESNQSLDSPDHDGELTDCALETVEQLAFADLLLRR